ncbi:Chitin deacetylase [Mycena kentingensis (nom. inval.)]|nr:Chitin deacetylase [Mycena kentingensis (nom. inval.)]
MQLSNAFAIILTVLLAFTPTSVYAVEGRASDGRASDVRVSADAFSAPRGSMAHARNADSLPKAITSCVRPNTMAITFDDGPYVNMFVSAYEGTEKPALNLPHRTDISDMFTKRGGKATFFINGNNYDCIYHEDVVKRLRYVFDAHHQIASHTWSHPDLSTCSESRIRSEIDRLDVAMLAILGIKTQYLRPPFGSYNNKVTRVATEKGKSLVIWDFDSGDSVGKSWEQSEELYTKKFDDKPENIMALNHETQPDTVAHIVPWLIEEALAAGYELVTVAECLGEEPYTFQGPFGERDASVLADMLLTTLNDTQPSWTCKKSQ